MTRPSLCLGWVAQVNSDLWAPKGGSRTFLKSYCKHTVMPRNLFDFFFFSLEISPHGKPPPPQAERHIIWSRKENLKPHLLRLCRDGFKSWRSSGRGIVFSRNPKPELIKRNSNKQWRHFPASVLWGSCWRGVGSPRVKLQSGAITQHGSTLMCHSPSCTMWGGGVGFTLQGQVPYFIPMLLSIFVLYWPFACPLQVTNIPTTGSKQ